jgi:hypothetical protein
MRADNFWRRTGNLTIAQTLLRHEPATTAGYLHPAREDLEAALRALDQGVNPRTHDNVRYVKLTSTS